MPTYDRATLVVGGRTYILRGVRLESAIEHERQAVHGMAGAVVAHTRGTSTETITLEGEVTLVSGDGEAAPAPHAIGGPVFDAVVAAVGRAQAETERQAMQMMGQGSLVSGSLVSAADLDQGSLVSGVETDHQLRARMASVLQRHGAPILPVAAVQATGADLDAIAARFGVQRLTTLDNRIDPVIDAEANAAMARIEARKTRPEAKSRYERLMAPDDIV